MKTDEAMTKDESSVYSEIERWVRDVYLPKEFGKKFREKKLLLQSRGEGKFSAVSEDEEVVATICARPSYGTNGKVDEEVLLKVRSDALKILWLDATPAKRFMAVVDPTMIRLLKEEKKKGRFPKELEIVRVKLSSELESKLDEARKKTGGNQ